MSHFSSDIQQDEIEFETMEDIKSKYLSDKDRKLIEDIQGDMKSAMDTIKQSIESWNIVADLSNNKINTMRENAQHTSNKLDEKMQTIGEFEYEVQYPENLHYLFT